MIWGGEYVGEPRNQFTFYRSYYDAIQELPKEERADIVLAICGYGLYEAEPEGLSAVGSAFFKLARPTLDSGRRKEANRKQTASKPKARESMILSMSMIMSMRLRLMPMLLLKW